MGKVTEPCGAWWRIKEVGKVTKPCGAWWRIKEVGKVTEPCGAWWRIKEACRRSYVASSSASSSVLSKVFPLISLFFWCHMYDVLVYKMLWDRKKILNISLWKIIRLSMRPAIGLCPHISLERVYCTNVSLVKFFFLARKK